MKPLPGTSGVVKPQGNQKRIFHCKECGKTFMEAPLLPLLPVRCPHCGSFRTGEDRRVRY
jgi:DNA-directed RNA polymerase subunit RPC12/RpoP